jgi:hypothetical protein
MPVDVSFTNAEGRPDAETLPTGSSWDVRDGILNIDDADGNAVASYQANKWHAVYKR